MLVRDEIEILTEDCAHGAVMIYSGWRKHPRKSEAHGVLLAIDVLDASSASAFIYYNEPFIDLLMLAGCRCTYHEGGFRIKLPAMPVVVTADYPLDYKDEFDD